MYCIPIMIKRLRALWLLVPALLLMAGCSAPLLPDPRQPQIEPEVCSNQNLIAELRHLWQGLEVVKMDEGERGRLIADYNAKLLELMRRIRYNFHEEGLDVALNDVKSFTISDETVDGAPRLVSIYEDIVPSADVILSNIEERYTVPGLGVPMVGVVPAQNVEKVGKRRVPVKDAGTVNIMTVLLEFPKGKEMKPVLRFISRTENETVRVGRLGYQLAADFSSAIEVYWNLTKLKKSRLLGLLRPQELRDVTGLSCMEPYAEDKIPVVLTHGLMSSAETFSNLVNRLLSDPEIRKHYQFWYYNYPTGIAWTFTARDLRDSLRTLRHKLDANHSNPNWRRLVVVGHSMGGLITHYNQCLEPWMILRNSKDEEVDFTPYLDRKYLNSPAPTPAAESLRRTFFFRPLEANLVVYMATPHRGAPMAMNRIVSWLVSAVRLPERLVTETLSILTLQEGTVLTNPEKIHRWFTSVDQLSPESWSIVGLHGLPVRQVKTHSIIGNWRGRELQRSSDGVVPYWSSHIPWGGETVVESDHSVQDAEETAEVMKRLLKENLKAPVRTEAW